MTQQPQDDLQPRLNLQHAMPVLVEPSGSKRLLISCLMLGLLIGLGVLGWFAVEESKTPRPLAEIPLIKADTEPYKKTPEDPGGLEVPDKDRMVYNTISSSTQGRQDVIDAGMAELTKPEEAPVSREEIKKLAQAEIATTTSAENVTNAATIEPAAGEPIAEEEATPPAETTEPSPTITASPSAEKTDDTAKSETIEKPVKKEIKVVKLEQPSHPISTPKKIPAPASMGGASASKGSSAKTGSVKVQLGAFRTEASLKKEWGALKKKFSSDLGSRNYSIESVDLGAKGMFYRLQIAAKNSADAQELCTHLKARKQGCMLVK